MPRDSSTIDLFRDYAPGPVVPRYPAERVKAATLRMLLARAIAQTLAEQHKPRAEIAAEMSSYLDEIVTPAMLDKYASQASAAHTIPAHRLIALVVATGDVRLLNALAAEAGLIVIGAKYEALIKREMAKEARDRLDREISA